MTMMMALMTIELLSIERTRLKISVIVQGRGQEFDLGGYKC